MLSSTICRLSLHRCSTLLLQLALLSILWPVTTADAQQPLKAEFGLQQRIAWEGSRILGTPDRGDPYTLKLKYPGLQFLEPIATGTIPGSSDLLLATRPGKIYSFANDRSVKKANLILDIDRPTFGVVMHPNFASNGYFYIMNTVDESDTGSRVSRFQLQSRDPLKASVDSELVIIEWPQGGHNGGCLRFGPDGMLYIATGDGSGIADGRQTGQDVTDLLGAILRLDVDSPSTTRPYGIPGDNPFAGNPAGRDEIYSYGHRQVWKFSFDPANGNLWAGEVGQDLWEMVYLIKNGGNYGWSVREGSHPFRPERPLGPAPIEDPIVELNHADFRSITGGYVYSGSQHRDLRGTYIFAGFDTGRIWGFRYRNGRVRGLGQLVDTSIRPVAIGQDNAGEVYFLDYAGGQVHELVPASNDVEVGHRAFPRKLSQTGLFTSTADLIPAPGVISYSVNSELWSDHASKQRLMAIPGKGTILFDDVDYPQPAPGAPPGWRFPDNTVLVKTFFLELESGNPDSRRRLETRILHHKKMDGETSYGAQFWRGYTYVWNDSQTEAILLGSDGADREFTIRDAAAPGGVRTQVWHFPSRAECTLCHTMSAKYSLGVYTMQMNKIHNYGDVFADQLKTLEHIGMFEKPLPAATSELPRLVDYRDTSADLNLRVRSYLHSNCAHCHRKWGGGNAEFQLLASLPLSETGTLGVKPGQGSFKLESPELLVPGQPERSMIYHRMKLMGLGHMPHVASNIRHDDAVELVYQWIRQMADKGYDQASGIEDTGQ